MTAWRRRSMEEFLQQQRAMEAGDDDTGAGPPAQAAGAAVISPGSLPDPYTATADGQLSDREQADLATCEAALDNLRVAFWAAGKALQVIRDARLYCDTHATFEDYVEQRWDMSHPRVYRRGCPRCRRDAVVELAAAADRSLPREVVAVAVDAAAPTGRAMSCLAAALAADPGVLTSGAPPTAGRLAAELIARGSGTLRVPACAVCGRAGKPLFRGDGGGVCQRCRAWQLPAACGVCGKVKPVCGRGASGQPVCEVCRRRGPAPHRACGTCGKTAPVALRGRGGQPDICVNCYRLPAAACSACGRIRPCTFAATSQPVCKQCAPRATAICARCGQDRPPAARWPEGPVCDTCYTAAPRRRGRREHGHDPRGIYDVKFPVLRDDDVTAVLAGAQPGSGHDGAFLLRQHGRVRARRLSHQLPVWTLRPVPAEVPSCRYPGSPPSRPASRGEAQQRAALAAGRLLPRPAAPRLQAHPQHHRGTAGPGPDPDPIADQAPGPPAPPTAP